MSEVFWAFLLGVACTLIGCFLGDWMCGRIIAQAKEREKLKP